MPKGWIDGDSTVFDIKQALRRTNSPSDQSYRSIPITIELAAILRSERDRTGYGPAALLRRFAATSPRDLKRSTISGWLNLSVLTGKASEVRWVLSCYATLPDKAHE